MDTKALFNIGYGLYVLSAREGEKDSGCIVNTVMQVTSDPLAVVVAVNRSNYTNGMIARTGVFDVSVLSEDATFDVFRRFGFQSGATADKFAGFAPTQRTGNGLLALDGIYANAVLECRVTDAVELSTHTLFFGEVTDAKFCPPARRARTRITRRTSSPSPRPKRRIKRCGVARSAVTNTRAKRCPKASSARYANIPLPISKR